MLVINFAQVTVAFRCIDMVRSLDDSTSCAIICSARGACVIAGAVAYRYVPESHKKTFYEHLTFKQYVETFWRNEATFGIDHKGRDLTTQDGIQAILPLVLLLAKLTSYGAMYQIF
jgi:hypothetical protein